MNFKKTALVLAMAGIVAAPMAVQAGSTGDGAYASIRIGLQMLETGGGEGVAGGAESTKISGLASRFGFKGETDLGNGMTGYGQYEFEVNAEQTSNNATAPKTIRVRKALVGVKGDFGSVQVGTDYQTFYKHAYGPLDNPWWGSGYAIVRSGGRQTNGLTYAGGSGAVSYGVTLLMNDSATGATNAAGNVEQEVIDETQLGLSFDAGFGTIGFGYADNAGTVGADPDAIIGLVLSGISAGPVGLGFGYQTQDVVNTSRTKTAFIIDASFGGGYFHYETLDNDDVAGGAADKTSLTLGYSMSLGPQTTTWFEYHDVDADTVAGSAGDLTSIRAMLKYDI
jgi:predicted porin